MKMIDNTSLPVQLEFLARVDADPENWRCATFEARDGDAENIVARGFDITKALPDTDGAALLEPPDRLRAFVLASASGQLKEFLDSKGWPADIAELAPTQLKAIAAQLEKTGSRRDLRSTLYQHRFARKSNLIMVADDDALMCAALKGGLERYGRCVFAHKAGDILDTYIRHSPDCLFLDLHLGYDSGMNSITEILAYDRDAHIVMLTADSTATHAVDAKTRGAKSFIAKPMVFSRVEYELFRSPTFRRWAG